MAVKEIIMFGSPKLKRVSKRIEKIDEEVVSLVKDLKDSLYSTTGIGLAAPQIGVLKRAIIIDLREGEKPIILINPAIVAKVGKEESIEGCLSYPGYEGKVIRPKKVTVKGVDINGKKVEYTAEGLLAKAFCHEIDHLDGILYTDRAKKVYRLEE
ncbi:peptide deformylase [Clostridium sp. YIM B02515]|uniref:Peptide deformylase n=1 Tax=Clostridium rhizosphaerae TaxID=2803861 RepID=A0ABS1T7C9_9CLOT|nr:peptide deformylase [Clostridium rhizosphaerae]MBL4935249.1 peptide deformylase [Clostridium rhizosphaerae]